MPVHFRNLQGDLVHGGCTGTRVPLRGFSDPTQRRPGSLLQTPRTGPRRSHEQVTRRVPHGPEDHGMPSRIRSVSRSRSRDLALYRRLRSPYLIAHPRCCYPGCRRKATQIHHTRGKIHGLLCMVEFWKPICFEHHDWVTWHPRESRAMGLICEEGLWNTLPRDVVRVIPDCQTGTIRDTDGPWTLTEPSPPGSVVHSHGVMPISNTSPSNEGGEALCNTRSL